MSAPVSTLSHQAVQNNTQCFEARPPRTLKQKPTQKRTNFQGCNSSTFQADVLYQARDLLGMARTTLKTFLTYLY